MKRIYKYQLKDIVLNDTVTINLPKGAKIIHTLLQNDQIYIWAEIDTAMKDTQRTFEVFGTGFNFPDDIRVELVYLATIQDDIFIWHIYERLN